jgi:hypothetical protein
VASRRELAKIAIQTLEGRDGQVDLAAHLEHGRKPLSWQAHGDVPDGAQIGRDVLADCAIAAGRAADEHAVFVDQRHRETVDLQLAHVVDGSIGAAFELQRPGRELSAEKTLSRESMGDVCWTGANSSEGLPPTRSWGCRGDEVGVFGLDGAQLA